MEDLDAGPVKLLEIFQGEKEYKSPIFQREYVWSDLQLTRMWSDIDALLDGTEKTKFLGAIVIEVKSAGKSFQPDEYWIVDGQQRLTTLYMTILRLALESERANNLDLAEFLYKQYLFKQGGKYLNEPKIVPTILDNNQFRSLFNDLHSRTPQLVVPYGNLTGTLTEGYKRIHEELKKRCYTDEIFDNDKATILSETILEKLKFVQIILGSDQEPQQVYDALNNAGVTLSIKDILKNKVFQSLSKDPGKAIALHTNSWLPFESELKDKIIGKGVKSKITYKDRFNEYFFPFALVHKSTVTKSNLCQVLSERWSKWEPDKVVEDLRVYAPCYNALTSNKDEYRQNLTESEEVKKRISRLYRMKIPTSIYPFLFVLIQSYKSSSLNEELTLHNLDLVESFLVRRAFAGLEPTGLHAVFKELWDQTKGSPKEFIRIIDKNPTIKFPDNKTFEENIRYSNLYSRKLAPYIIAEYERDIKGGDPFVEGEKLTIDHVAPQKLTDEWKLVIDQKDHEKYKDTWANLVPLSMPANAEKGRKSWETVRAYLKTEIHYKTTKRLAEENDVWDIESIKKRSDSLVIWAMDRWPKA